MDRASHRSRNFQRAALASLLLAITTVATLVLAAAAPRAHAGEVTRCGDSRSTQPRGLCGDFEAAPRLAPTDPMGQQALRVWARVADPVAALSERHTGLVLLAPKARMHDGRLFPPTAYTCPGAPPVVYVPYDLVASVFGPKATYTNDFFAFVLGHELGHRLDDFTLEGCELAAFARRGAAIDQERLADFRGAFFAAIAGFDPRALANAQIVTTFLKREFRTPVPELQARAAALTNALATFGTYEDIYQAAVAVLLLGQRQAASRLLAWLDERVRAEGVPLPELALVHALALLQEAAPEAPWLDRLGKLSAPDGVLACRTVFPTHSALWEDLGPARVRAGGPARRRAERTIADARALLATAADMGASPLAVASASACAAFLAGEPGEALRQLERAKKRASIGKAAAPPVQNALSANESLIRFALWLDTHAPPAKSDAGHAAWLARLAQDRAGFASHEGLARYLDRLSGTRTAPPAASHDAATTAVCDFKSVPMSPLVPAAATHGPAGLCPSGFVVRTLVPAPSANFVVCAAAGGPERIVRVTLPNTAGSPAKALTGQAGPSRSNVTEPQLASVDLTLALSGAPRDARAELATWACACTSFEPRGASDTGEAAYVGTCPSLGAPVALVLADTKGRVRRVAVMATR